MWFDVKKKKKSFILSKMYNFRELKKRKIKLILKRKWCYERLGNLAEFIKRYRNSFTLIVTVCSNTYAN